MKDQLVRKRKERGIKFLLGVALLGFISYMVFCSVTIFTVVMVTLGGYLIGRMLFYRERASDANCLISRYGVFSVLYIVLSIVCLGFFLSLWCGIVFSLLGFMYLILSVGRIMIESLA